MRKLNIPTDGRGTKLKGHVITYNPFGGGVVLGYHAKVGEYSNITHKELEEFVGCKLEERHVGWFRNSGTKKYLYYPID